MERGYLHMIDSDELVIETQNLGKRYKDVQALQGLNLQVRRNSIFGFLGPNGAGKTTTIRLLLMLARPTSGSARIFGLDVQRDSIAIRQRLGYLSQSPRFYEHLSARQVLRFILGFFFDGPRNKIEQRIQETLELVSLADKADRPIRGFSGGERQRLGIAQAQVNHPDLLILDEPAANLDPQGRHDVLRVMERLRGHTTIFYSTHILDDVQRVSDTVAILDHGRLLAQAPVTELLAGTGNCVYCFTLEGSPEATRQRVAAMPWVTEVVVADAPGCTKWKVTVSDEAAAREQLLRLALADPEAKVSEFRRQQYVLEDIFLAIVAGKDARYGVDDHGDQRRASSC